MSTVGIEGAGGLQKEISDMLGTLTMGSRHAILLLPICSLCSILVHSVRPMGFILYWI